MTKRETEAETRRREIVAAETLQRQWQNGHQHGDDDSFNRPDTPPLAARQPSPPAVFSLPSDSVILRHRRRCRANAAATAPPRSSSSSSSSSTSGGGDDGDEAGDRRSAKHHRISSRCRYASRAKRGANHVNNRLVQLQARNCSAR